MSDGTMLWVLMAGMALVTLALRLSVIGLLGRVVGAGLQILENRRHGHARTAQNQRPADFARHALHCGALRPIERH